MQNTWNNLTWPQVFIASVVVLSVTVMVIGMEVLISVNLRAIITGAVASLGLVLVFLFLTSDAPARLNRRKD